MIQDSRIKAEPPKPPKSKHQAQRNDVKDIMKALGLDQLGLEDQVDLD